MQWGEWRRGERPLAHLERHPQELGQEEDWQHQGEEDHGPITQSVPSSNVYNCRSWSGKAFLIISEEWLVRCSAALISPKTRRDTPPSSGLKVPVRKLSGEKTTENCIKCSPLFYSFMIYCWKFAGVTLPEHILNMISSRRKEGLAKRVCSMWWRLTVSMTERSVIICWLNWNFYKLILLIGWLLPRQCIHCWASSNGGNNQVNICMAMLHFAENFANLGPRF